ncbi:hypothetical protein [Devosia naphthalenivorans]|uniref:hypothetical protein n=1 Tax=Devosia naphthalenivorans TaxID=2082392 RepID=UPI0013B05753|nr:hypothetical protein [Devosia naphthalenivorans]
MATGFVSANLVPSGGGSVVRRAAYNSRKRYYVEATQAPYRAPSRKDYITGGLCLPHVSQRFGSGGEAAWNNLDRSVASPGPVAIDLILGLPRKSELQVSELVVLLQRFAAPIVQEGHMVQFDIHALQRDASVGPYRHAHVLIALFGKDAFGKPRRIRSPWAAVFRASQGLKRSQMLPDWRAHWRDTQNRFFEEIGRPEIKVPLELGPGEVRIGPFGRLLSPAADDALVSIRSELQRRFSDNDALIRALADRLWLFERGDVSSLLATLNPESSWVSLQLRCDDLLTSTVKVVERGRPVFGTPGSLRRVEALLTRAQRLYEHLDFVSARAPHDFANAAWEQELDPIWRAEGAERLSLIEGQDLAALVGDGAAEPDAGPLQTLIADYLAAGIGPTILVPDLQSRWRIQHICEDRAVRCETVRAFVAPNVTRSGSGKKLVLLFDAQRASSPELAALLQKVEQEGHKLVLVFDRSQYGHPEIGICALAVLARLGVPSTLTASPQRSSDAFSWADHAQSLAVTDPAATLGIFAHQKRLGFYALEALMTAQFVQSALPACLIVGSQAEAKSINYQILVRRGRAPEQDRKTIIDREPSLLSVLRDGDPVYFASDWSEGKIAAGTLVRIIDIDRSNDLLTIEAIGGERLRLPNAAQVPLRLAFAMPLQMAVGAARAARDPAKLFGRSLVYVSDSSVADQLVRFAALHNGLRLMINTGLAGSLRSFAALLSASRPTGVAKALAEFDFSSAAEGSARTPRFSATVIPSGQTSQPVQAAAFGHQAVDIDDSAELTADEPSGSEWFNDEADASVSDDELDLIAHETDLNGEYDETIDVEELDWPEDDEATGYNADDDEPPQI